MSRRYHIHDRRYRKYVSPSLRMLQGDVHHRAVSENTWVYAPRVLSIETPSQRRSTGEWPKPAAEFVTGGNARYQIYRTSDGGYLAAIGPRLLKHFRELDVLQRPLGNTVYVMPPYCISDAELDTVYNAIATAI